MIRRRSVIKVNDIDKLFYAEAREQVRNLSNIFYILLGFIITIIGAFISTYLVHIKDVKHDIPASYGSLMFGALLLLLLIILAKVSRISADNSVLMKDFDNISKSNICFKPTGIPGIANAITFYFLSLVTSAILLWPIYTSYYGYEYFVLIGLSVLLFLLIYYVLSDGKLFSCGRCVDIKCQWVAYIIIVIGYILYYLLLSVSGKL